MLDKCETICYNPRVDLRKQVAKAIMVRFVPPVEENVGKLILAEMLFP